MTITGKRGGGVLKFVKFEDSVVFNHETIDGGEGGCEIG